MPRRLQHLRKPLTGVLVIIDNQDSRHTATVPCRTVKTMCAYILNLCLVACAPFPVALAIHRANVPVLRRTPRGRSAAWLPKRREFYSGVQRGSRPPLPYSLPADAVGAKN